MSKKALENFSVTIGLISGVALGLVILFIWILRIDLSSPQPSISASATPTSDILYFGADTTPSQPDVNETPDPLESNFATAEAAISQHDADTARSILLPLSNQGLSEADQARANGDLGDLEEAAGHDAVACVYYANQFMNENSASVLNTLANTCLSAGYLSEARNDFQKLADWPDASGDPYREDAKAALLAIGGMQGTPLPSPTPGSMVTGT